MGQDGLSVGAVALTSALHVHVQEPPEAGVLARKASHGLRTCVEFDWLIGLVGPAQAL